MNFFIKKFSMNGAQKIGIISIKLSLPLSAYVLQNFSRTANKTLSLFVTMWL